MEPQIFVDRTYRRAAWTLIYLYIDLKGFKTKTKAIKERPPLDLKADGLHEEVAASIEHWYMKHGLPIENAIKQLVDEAAGAYLYMLYARAIKGFGHMAALAFLASPPDITLKTAGPVIKPSSYINVHFIPTKMKRNGKTKWHRNTLARYFYSIVASQLTGRSGHLRNFIMENQALKTLYERNRKKYVDKGYRPGRATRLAFRDCLRAIIGSIWMVRVLELLETRTIRPDDVVLPYPALVEKAKAGELIDPWQLLPPEAAEELKDYTWKRLLQELGV